jgi:hypothetical protein
MKKELCGLVVVRCKTWSPKINNTLNVKKLMTICVIHENNWQPGFGWLIDLQLGLEPYGSDAPRP